MISNELCESKNQIETLTNQEVSTLAYPKGAYNSTVLEKTAAAGYRYAFKISFGTVSSVTKGNRYVLPRTVMRGGSMNWFNYCSIKGGYDWTKYYSLLKNALKWRVLQ
jgi:hypothetical protein